MVCALGGLVLYSWYGRVLIKHWWLDGRLIPLDRSPLTTFVRYKRSYAGPVTGVLVIFINSPS